MQVNRIQSNNNQPNFGMALYMKDAKVFKKVLGNNTAKTLEAAKPKLEELANDVDIFVKPRRFADNPFMPLKYIGVSVQEKNITLKDKIMRLLRQRPPYKTDTWLNPNYEDIVENTTRLKKELLNWIAE